MSQIVVFFNGVDGSADYLDVREQSDKRIRGWVINGHWEMVIDLVNKTVNLDQSRHYTGTVLEELSKFYSIEIEPVRRSGDYNRVIELARERVRARLWRRNEKRDTPDCDDVAQQSEVDGASPKDE